MRFIGRFLGFVFGLAAFGVVIGGAVAGFFIWKYSQGLPDHQQLAAYEPPVMTRIHAADGALMAEYAAQRRLYLPIQTVPKLLIDAFLSAEDKNFYEHNGIDPTGIARAVVNNFRGGSSSRQQGASTITQQVAKNFLLTNEQTLERKIKEALLALRIESTFSKDKILELYLNEIYLGLGNYGVAAAALNYFGRSVNELTLAQAAYLAALPKAPNNYNPFSQHEAAVTRRNWVIDRMVENGYVDRKAGDTAKAEPLTVTLRTVSPDTLSAGFFAEEVRRELADRYGYKKLYESGLSVRTTLDRKLQRIARKALTDGLVRFDEAHGWRGAVKKIPPTSDWGQILGEEKSYNDIKPWRLAVVLNVNANSAEIGLQPPREPSGALSKQRETGTITSQDGGRLLKKNVAATLSAGDVIYVEPVEGKAGIYRLRQIPEVSGAIVAIEPYTGRVLAMIGGFSYDMSEFNRATQAMRQPGSAFKPFVYATALDNGYTPSSIVMDEPIEIDQGGGQGMWRPDNFDGKSHGPKTLRYGVVYSKNQMTVRLARDVGMPLIAEYAKRFGIYDDLAPYLSMSLGAGETTVLRLTAAYAMLDNGGKRIRPTLIDRIQDRWGTTIFKHEERKCIGCQAEEWKNQDEPKLVDDREQVIDPMTAYQITSIMEGVIQYGTGASIRDLGKTLAGKTGTTNGPNDLWFVGYSPDLAVGVYIGYDKPRPLGTGKSAQASTWAAPIFKEFMKLALAGKPDSKFRIPPDMKLIRVSKATGMRAGPGDEGAILEAFKPGTAPPESFNYGGAGASGTESDKAVTSGTGGLY
jgi:penicillin-binding protein 1A